MLLDFFSLPIVLLRFGGVWDGGISTKSQIVQLLWKIYYFLVRYAAVSTTIILYVMHLTVVKDFEVSFPGINLVDKPAFLQT